VGSVRRILLFTAVLTLAACAAGCSGSTAAQHKPATRVTVLRLANGDSGIILPPAVARFAGEVKKASKDSVRVEVVPLDWSNTDPGYEQRILRGTAAGSFDLAWVGTRAFSALGVTDFEALLAPMLIDTPALQAAVIGSDIPKRMLAGSEKAGVTGLGVFADRLRTPYSVKRAYASPADFKGASMRVFRSVEEEAAARALGARITNVTGDRLREGLADGSVNVAETDAETWARNALGPGWTLANVVLWPRTVALVANPKRFDSLTAAQRSAIRAAAMTATSFSLTIATDQSGGTAACAAGVRYAQVPAQNITAFQTAFAPVYAELRRDATTGKYLDDIANLKRKIASPPHALPSPCS
jgi:TRAP-type C4-dicarboxylate transport system substrate-binding protein